MERIAEDILNTSTVKGSMITIQYNGNLEKIKTAVICANSILIDPMFYQTICKAVEFDMANATPAQIANMIRYADISMRVLMYIASPRVHGYDDVYNPDLIHINVFRSDWTISGIVNTMIHQVVHAVDHMHPEFSFGHGDRTCSSKENTAPYKIASIAEEMLTEKPAQANMIHEAPPESLAVDTLN
jgi:hypothetical protein